MTTAEDLTRMALVIAEETIGSLRESPPGECIVNLNYVGRK